MMQASQMGPQATPAPASHAIVQRLANAVGTWWRSRTETPRQLHLVETLALGPKRSVALLELDGQRFLAGMGADGVSTLLQVQPCTGKGETRA